MEETPKFIYLTPDDEDQDHIIWTNNDMGNGETPYVRRDVAVEWYDTQLKNKIRYREIAIEAAKMLEMVSSADGSGHADLGRRVREMVANVD